jgi:hypothetical protein
MVVAFLLGNAPVRKHLNIIGPFDGDRNCRFCKLETETAAVRTGLVSTIFLWEAVS